MGIVQADDYDQEAYILVVDDDETLLKFFKIHLNKFFAKIMVVKNAREAVDALERNQIDLVLSDIRMPRLDGIQLMRKIRAHNPTIPVFLISGAMLDTKQTDTVDTKADGFLKKPFSIDELHHFISEGLRYREIYKRLFEIVPDRKKFQNLVRGRSFPKISDADLRQEAKILFKSLKDDSEPQAS